MSLGMSFLEEDNEAKVSGFSVELRKPFEKLGISPPFKKEVMSVSYRFEKLLEKIIVRYERIWMSIKMVKLWTYCWQLYETKMQSFKIIRSHIKALLAELFFGAGDTSSILTQWAMAEIINNPKILERLRQEIESVVGNTRELEQGCKIRGFCIPKGTSLVINAYAIMRDVETWKDPDEFKPERFLGEEDERREKVLSYLPFGTGRRGCPGSNLSYAIVGTAFGVMVQCFDWKIEGDKVNMEEATGRTFLALAHPLKCTSLPRIMINPLPSNL
ncbi:hypothetical protein N665_0431s0024 [Sinapis alba]|nr:hypothetical protein N665_0431s0024 [Sinapis alba]